MQEKSTFIVGVLFWLSFKTNVQIFDFAFFHQRASYWISDSFMGMDALVIYSAFCTEIIKEINTEV